MQRVSNNVTLLLKIFLPTFWFVFFTSLLAAIFMVDPDRIPLLASTQFRLIYIFMYIVFGLFLYFTVMRLYRVEFGPDHFTVSNYFKTFRYQYLDIESIDEQNYLIFRLMVIKLKAKGSFGKKIKFIPSYRNYEFFVNENPELFRHLTHKMD